MLREGVPSHLALEMVEEKLQELPEMAFEVLDIQIQNMCWGVSHQAKIVFPL